jgi:hypothetical protein
MKLHANVLRFSYLFYRIIDRITEFSFIIFSDFIHFMKCFILSMDYHLFFFSPSPIHIAFYSSYVNPLTINRTGQQSSSILLVLFYPSTAAHIIHFHVQKLSVSLQLTTTNSLCFDGRVTNPFLDVSVNTCCDRRGNTLRNNSRVSPSSPISSYCRYFLSLGESVFRFHSPLFFLRFEMLVP